MFDKLLVSTKDRRKGRTGKFLFVTSLCYSLTLASALVVSVFAASPQLYETMDDIKLASIPLALAPPSGPKTDAPKGNNQPTARPNPNNVQDLETITRTASTNQPPRTNTTIPTMNPIDTGGGGGGRGSGNGVDGGTNPFGGDIGITGDKGTEPPPLPVTKPIEKPQPPVERQIVRVSSVVLTGKAIERKTPAYPILAKNIHVEGSIVVEVVISLDGRVESARPLGGHPLLITAAVDAARGWRFQPTLLNGVAVRVTGVITFNFKLN